MDTVEQKYTVYYNRIPNSTFIFSNGVLAAFTGGRYVTKEASEIAELDAAVAAKNAHIYVDADKRQLTEEELDPMAEYKARVIADYLAKHGGAVEASSSDAGKLNVATSADLVEIAAESLATGARVVPTLAKTK